MSDTYQGLVEDVIEVDGGKPFRVSTFECKRCGLTNDYADTDTVCSHCGTKLRKKVKKDIHKNTTKGIIDRKVVYKCPECGKVYDRPTQCCIAEFNSPTKLHGETRTEYLCTGCNHRYVKPVVCCPGSLMVEGTVYPEMTMEEFKKIRTSLLKPVLGVMQ